MKDQLTATLFGMVVLGTAIAAGAQPTNHLHRTVPAAPSASTVRASDGGQQTWEHKRLTYGGA